MSYSTQQDNARPKGSRNCLWLVPLGCLGGIVVLGASIAGIGFIAVSFLRSNGATRGAFERLQAHPQAIDALGEPIKMGWLMSGSINIDGPSGDAELSIPVSGPRGSGTLYVEAEKQAGAWDYQLLELAIDGSSQRIDLLPAFTVNPYWQLPDTQLFQPVFATDNASDVQIDFLATVSF